MITTFFDWMDEQVRPYARGSIGKCPFCQVTVRFDSPREIRTRSGIAPPTYLYAKGKGIDQVHVYSSQCTACFKPIIAMQIIYEDKKGEERLVFPPNVVRIVPPEVPTEIQEDFLEAAAVLAISETASAALSRRCLQNLLTNNGIKGKNLSDQIDDALSILPMRLAENLDAIRKIGNFAAHPTKYKTTGLIVDVEPEEANWNLDVLEDLFEYFYVAPKKAREKRKKLDKKLAAMGKKPTKKP